MKFEQMKTSTFKKENLKIRIFIVVLLALTIGIVVYYISDPFFNKNLNVNSTQELQLTDEKVKFLYDYVSYSKTEIKNDVFVTNDRITKDNMPDEDKLHCALRFASTKDFIATGKKNSKNNQIFNVSDEKIDTYMKKFFGSNVTYENVKEYEYSLDYNENIRYVAILTYNDENKGYDTILTQINKKNIREEDKVYVQPFYTKLVNAYLHKDQTIELKEKVIYTKVEKIDELYTIKVYSDHNLQNEIEIRNNLTESQMKSSVFNLDEYSDKASTVTYTFKIESGKYYFESSVITNN